MKLFIFGSAIFFMFACGAKNAETAEKHEEPEHLKEDHGDHKEEDHKEEKDAVHLSKSAVERSQIMLEAASLEQIIGGVDAPAEVQLNPDSTAHVSPIVSAKIAEIKASLGDQVEKGQLLLTLRSEAVGDARAILAGAKAEVEVAKLNLARQQELVKLGASSQKDLINAEGDVKRAEAALASAQAKLGVFGAGGTNITSPIDGVVLERNATVGSVVSPEKPAFIIADLSKVWVIGQVYEQDVAAAQLGAPAVVYLQAYPDKSWKGTISYIASTLDEQSRTLGIRVELENSEGILRPGLSGNISLLPPGVTPEPVLVVPEDAVQRYEGGEVVFIPSKHDGEFHAIVVTTGVRSHGKIEIKSGLKEGDKVVTKGAFTLKSELLKGELGEGHSH
jgi:cobalt-zinc-cadmium efflux system membrane fusion protein